VLLAWGDQDKLFPLDHAQRLEADFPNARLEVIAGSSTYVMLDRPDELALAMSKFLAEGPAAP
jgi:pimeloyl-ACP methyl ester carboxylesterase